MIEKNFDFLKDKNITDVLLVGFIDLENDIYKFYPVLKYLYFEIDSKYLMFESIDQYSRLRYSVKDAICYEYDVDEDMSRATTSIAEIVLDDTMAIGNSIKEIIFYDLDEQQLTCASMEIVLQNGQMIFIDPSFYFGINIGGERAKRKWEDNYIYIDTMKKCKIVL